ncbi:two-component system phosphate regulon response regulator OmpR [Stella humosa]|uniref:Two-component system phosphate regulon response regulator OmpR n=1 Tax=Stella humosa TaxID=94 RepID=A0A3N1KVV9_9PROT|nr:response regulator [Stella humosa]ROP84084.1 two-component system phosphate regulon response regulator OmpR [Stella humosa]BBK33596.1 DNA-binding response regulator [Stella humosa]
MTGADPAAAAAPDTDDQPHVLVVDDDQRLRDLLRRYLAENGFRVTVAGDAAEARARLAAMHFDLLVLDVMMPGENGLELTRSLRSGSEMPILLLTAMGEAANRIAGLESGADDYLAKPFEPRELLLRMRTILRRGATAPTAAVALIQFGPFRFEPRRGELRRGATAVRLTQAETGLLRALAENPGTAVSREELADAIGIQGSVRTVDVQMTRLRRKVEADPRYPRYLQTVRGTGYVLIPD